MTTIVVVDYKLENHTCTIFTDKEHFKEWLSSDDSDIYFVDVTDETWNELKTKNSKRLELTLDELNELLQKASYVFLINGDYVESCMYYPKDDDP